MKRPTLLLPLVLAFGCATTSAPTVPADARAELAPTGKLRVGLIAVNPIFVTPNTPLGVTRGVAVDIASALASRIGVPMEPLLAGGAKEVPGSRVLRTSFVDSPVGMAVARMRPAAHAYAYQFVEEMKASGAVREAIAREGLVGVRAAVPARW